MVTARPLLRAAASVALLAAVAGASVACDVLLVGPEALLDDVNARLIVLDVDPEHIVALDVAGEQRRSAPRDERADVQIELALPVGVHAGDVVLLRREGDDADDLAPDRCGTFSFDVVAGEVDVVVVDIDELQRCGEDDDDGDEGEGEGDGEEGEGEDDGGEGEGEGDGGDECDTLVERFDDAALSDGLALEVGGDASAIFDGTMRLTNADLDDGDPAVRYEAEGAAVRASVVVVDTSATEAAAFLSVAGSDWQASLFVGGAVAEARYVDETGALSTVTTAITLPATLALTVGAGGVTWEAGALGALAAVRSEPGVGVLEDGRVAVGLASAAGAAQATFDDLIIEDGCAP